MEVVEENTPISGTNNVEEEDSDVEEKKLFLGKRTPDLRQPI
jgi:hypothetical protein